MGDVLRAWQMVQGQWRVGLSGVVSGDYAAWAAILRPFGLWNRRVIHGLRAFELAALQEFREREHSARYYSDPEYARWVEDEVARAKG